MRCNGWSTVRCRGSLSKCNGNSLGTSIQIKSFGEREVKLTSEWLKDRWIVEIPFAAAAAFASPCNVTSGTPASFGRISISFMAAPAPLEETPSDLNTASLPTQRPAKDAWKDGWARQYAISAVVKLREINVSFSVGTEEINSTFNCQRRKHPGYRKHTLVNANPGGC